MTPQTPQQTTHTLEANDPVKAGLLIAADVRRGAYSVTVAMPAGHVAYYADGFNQHADPRHGP